MPPRTHANSGSALAATLHRYPPQLLKRAAAAFARLGDARDREAMHDFRVAVRRLRTWLRLAEGADDREAVLTRDLRQLARDTNRTRDLEIELEWLRARRTQCGGRRRAALEVLLKQRRRALRASNAQIRRDLTARWPKLIRSLRATRARAGAPGYPRALAEAIRKLIGSLHKIKSRRDDTAIHRARIRAKRVRYLLEPCRTLDARVEDAVTALVKMQDDFGRHHDCVAIIESLRDMARHADAVSLPALTTWLRAAARAEQRDVFKACERDHLRHNAAAHARQLRAAAKVVRRALGPW